MLFLVSLLLLVWVSLRWVARLASTPADSYWIFVGVAMLQVGAVTSFTSLLHQLTPVGWVLAQAILAAASVPLTGGLSWPRWLGVVRAWRRQRAALAAFAEGLSIWAVLLLFAVGGVVLLTMVVQAAVPIQNFDDRMYHASRVLYWIQHRTVFPFETHNIRQTLVPFGSELFFLWPVLLTKTEAVGRLVFGLAFPMAAVGQYVLLRALKLSQTAALAGVLVLISTPLIVSSASGLKPEIWSVLTLLAVAYWAVSIGSGTEGCTHRYFFLGVFAVLSINVRSFPAALLPSLLLILWWAPGSFAFAARLKVFAAGLLCAGALSSLLVPLAFNTARYHHPMGPPEVQRVVRADVTPQMVYTHAVRFAFLLLELPNVPVSADARAGFSQAANRVISALGAGEPLKGEADGPWPGRYEYALSEQSSRFSIWGVLWIPVIAVAVWHLLRNLVVNWPRVRLTALSVQTLLAVPLLGAVLFGARWMAHSEVPGRFLAGPYALALPLGVVLVAPFFSAKRGAQALLALVMAYAAFAPMRTLANGAVQAIASPLPDADLNEPFNEVLTSAMPPGSRVLLVGHQDARDYPLFSPGTRYSNQVIPWGTGAFDPQRMSRLIEAEKVTHVLIQDDVRVVFQWFSEVDTRGMVQWLNAAPGVKAVPLRTPRMRLYEVIGAATVSDVPFGVTEAPAASPLVDIEQGLRNQVGIDPTVWKAPWAVEDHGGRERGFLWLGQGYAEGLEFALWSRHDREVDIRLGVSQGPGQDAQGRRLMVLHDDMPVGDEHVFQDGSSVVVRTRLRSGRNLISVMALDAATVTPLPNGDVRNLVIGLHEIRIEAARASTDSGVKHRVLDNELARSARLVVGLLNRRQLADGYWFTSHTTGTVFERPVQEMNTYLTALMVDLLSTPSEPVMLASSLQRARAHLRNQIEPSGLVRYHGKPGGRAMRESGMCIITPDADDTALTWRIAPADDRWRQAALKTLASYRTDEGLYRTWLGRQDEYSCLNPGADPNPTDLGIQIHVLMWLAQVDPPVARALCQTLHRTVDQDRLWVYYRKAPLVPLMRQSDLKAAGCDLPLPLSRLHTDVPGQAIWLNAVRMLTREDTGLADGARRTQVLQLLRDLSEDGFSAVRQNPPMLYHNDLSASVSRLYWSEDVGYAIWLRLYLNTVGGQP